VRRDPLLAFQPLCSVTLVPLLHEHSTGITNNALIAASYISRFEPPLSQGGFDSEMLVAWNTNLRYPRS
jgi:hypothetical protein